MPSAIDPYAMGGNWETGHVFRYRLARGYIDEDSVIVDFGCGKGYGSQILAPYDTYIGCDIDEADIAAAIEKYADDDVGFRVVDLNTISIARPFDVAVCFECIEHVQDTTHLVGLLQQANKWIICSTPIIPTVGVNPYHVHDFVYDDLPRLIGTNGWELFQRVKQQGSDGNDVYGIYVFRRTNG